MFLHMPTFSNTRKDQSQARMLSTLPRLPEHPVPLLHELPVRPKRRVARQQEARVLESLQAVLQHRTVRLAENGRAQLHRQIRPIVGSSGPPDTRAPLALNPPRAPGPAPLRPPMSPAFY